MYWICEFCIFQKRMSGDIVKALFRSLPSNFRNIPQLLKKTKFLNEVSVFNPTLITALTDQFKKNQCHVCCESLDQWVIGHLCREEFCETKRVITEPSQNSQILVHTCSFECNPLICTFNPDNTHCYCGRCWDTVQVSQPLRFLFKKNPKHFLSVMYKKFKQHTYLVNLVEAKTIPLDKFVRGLYDKFRFQNFTCFVCKTPLQTNYFIIGSTMDPQQAEVVCGECKIKTKCGFCKTETSPSETVTCYRNLNGRIISLLSCVLCWTRQIQVLGPSTFAQVDVTTNSHFDLKYAIDEAQTAHIKKCITKDIRNLKHKDAERWGVEGSLSTGAMYNQLCKQNYQCYICARIVSWGPTSSCKKQVTDFSINRVNNNLPHNQDNVAVTCLHCNMNYRTCTQCEKYGNDLCKFVVLRGATYCLNCMFKKS
jgi:hypothetical protein